MFLVNILICCWAVSSVAVHVQVPTNKAAADANYQNEAKEISKQTLDNVEDVHRNVIVTELFELVEQNGKGGSSEVWHVSQRSTGKDFACKFIRINSELEALHELEIMQRLRHPHIIKGYSCYEQTERMNIQ
jgi:Protein kinase domain